MRPLAPVAPSHLWPRARRAQPAAAFAPARAARTFMPPPAIDFSVFADCASSHQLSLRSCLFLPPPGLLSPARSASPPPLSLSLSSSLATSATLTDAHPQRPARGARAGAGRSRGARRGGQGRPAGLGLGRGRPGAAEARRRERGAAGSRARARRSAGRCPGATCQQQRRLETRARAIYRHPRRRGRGAALASHCSICSAHPTQAEFGITLTMWEFFFSASPRPPHMDSSEILKAPLRNPGDGSALAGQARGEGDRCARALGTPGSPLSAGVAAASSPRGRVGRKVERRVAWLTIFLYRLTHNQCFRCFLKMPLLT